MNRGKSVLTQIGATNVAYAAFKLDGDFFDGLVCNVVDIVEARCVERRRVAGGRGLGQNQRSCSHEGSEDGGCLKHGVD